MISFNFKVGKSFLENDHRITIPRASKAQLEKQGLDEDNVAIVCPDGFTMAGRIYYSTSSWGPYYQLECRNGYGGDPLTRLKIGQLLKVEIKRIDTQVVVKLRLA
jgi:hypothetical protein